MNNLYFNHMETDLYTIYENDLKFKKYRKIDFNKVAYHDERTKELAKKDFDTLEARYEESRNNNYYLLDFSHMELSEFPIIPKDLYNVKHLFLVNNSLTSIPPLDKFTKLETLDVSHNKLLQIPTLPPSLTELFCHNNSLTTLPEIPTLLRLNCSDNNLSIIPSYPELMSITCFNNNLTCIKTLDKVQKMYVMENKLEIIPSFPLLKTLDISKNAITNIRNQPKLETLDLRGNRVDCKLENLDSLKKLDILNTNLPTIPYFKTLEEITFHENTIHYISSKYKLKTIKSGDKEIVIFQFS